jgi:tRNA modification GTPase
MRIYELLRSSGAEGVGWDSLLQQSFENDKTDFIQKEALQELVKARTKLGVKVLLDQYAGALSKALKEGLEIIKGIRESLLVKDNENIPPLFPPSQGGEGKFENEIVHPHPNPPPSPFLPLSEGDRGRESSVIQSASTSDGKKSDDLLHPPPSLGKETNDQSLNTTPSPGGRGSWGGGIDLCSSVSTLVNHIGRLLETASFGIALTSPQVLVILGKPNVGKSTLINAILGEDRMLVHHEPGTTRDYVSEFISVNGIPFELVDTAGVRETSDMLEVMSIKMTQGQLRRADKVITVFDNSGKFDQEDEGILNAVNSWLSTNSSGDLQNKVNAHTVIPVVNKCDLSAKLDKLRIESALQQPVCCISALNKEGFENLNRRLVQEFDTAYKPMNAVVFNKRQYFLLVKADMLIKQEKDGLAANNVSDKTFQVLDKLKDIFTTCLKGA